MKESNQQDQRKKKVTDVTTFPVPYALGELRENLSITTNTLSKLSKEELINQAIQFHLKGNISEATKGYQQLINQGLKDHTVFSNYGAILISLGKLKDAELYLRKSIDLNPDFALAHSNLGNTLKDLGNLKEAENSYRKAIEINPNLAEPYSNLGNILKDLNNVKDAEYSYRKAIQLNPDYTEAHSNLGTILLDLGKFQDAKASFLKAIELNSDYAEAYSTCHC